MNPSYIRRHPVASYYVLAVVLSWLVELPLVAAKQGWVQRQAGWIIVPGLMVGILFAAVVFTWIYNGTGGSVLYVAVWHGLFDMLTASKAGQDAIPLVMTVEVIVIVFIITRVKKPWNFYRLEKSAT